MKVLRVTNDYIHIINDDGESEFLPNKEPVVDVDQELRSNVAWLILLFGVVFYGSMAYLLIS